MHNASGRKKIIEFFQKTFEKPIDKMKFSWYNMQAL